MRQTKQIDDPTWDDVTDRDALIRGLCNAIHNLVLTGVITGDHADHIEAKANAAVTDIDGPFHCG